MIPTSITRRTYKGKPQSYQTISDQRQQICGLKRLEFGPPCPARMPVTRIDCHEKLFDGTSLLRILKVSTESQFCEISYMTTSHKTHGNVLHFFKPSMVTISIKTLAQRNNEEAKCLPSMINGRSGSMSTCPWLGKWRSGGQCQHCPPNKFRRCSG